MKKIIPILLLISCIEPFEPVITEGGEGVLVVDGSITNIAGQSFVKLEYSYPINGLGPGVATGASVIVTDDEGAEVNFSETGRGLYEPPADFAGTIGKSYQLRIRTREGDEYLSTQDRLLSPAPIDSIYGQFLTLASDEGTFEEGVQFFVDISGPSDEEYNFRIEYKEDYEVSVPSPSQFEFNAAEQRIDSRLGPSLRLCYANDASTGLLIATTSGQVSSNLREFPLVLIKDDDPELIGRYSLSLKSYRITPEAHKYYKDLQELNESGGSFFDRQKGTINSNIINVNDDSELVLGYFEVASLSEEFELFDGNEWEEDGFKAERPLVQFCNGQSQTISTISLFDQNFRFNNRLIQSFDQTFVLVSINGELYPASVILTPETCSDCRLYGSLEKPEFWND